MITSSTVAHKLELRLKTVDVSKGKGVFSNAKCIQQRPLVVLE